MSNNEDELDDMVKFYTGVFPSAIPIVYNHRQEYLFESRLNDLYGDTLFLIYKPLGKVEAENSTGRSFYLFLIRDVYTFEKYVDFFFNQTKGGGWRENDFSLRNNKIKCFGSVKLLMMDEDKKNLYSQYRNAIALAFKNGKNPVMEDKRTVSYLYNDNVLIETPEFFEWDESIEKKFEKDEK